MSSSGPSFRSGSGLSLPGSGIMSGGSFQGGAAPGGRGGSFSAGRAGRGGGVILGAVPWGRLHLELG